MSKKLNPEEILSSLNKQLGFDPNSGRPDEKIYASALELVVKKRGEELQGRAVSLIEKAMDLSQKYNQLKSEFNKAEGKHMKDLQKLVGSIQGMAQGKTHVDTEADSEEGDTTDGTDSVES